MYYFLHNNAVYFSNYVVINQYYDAVKRSGCKLVPDILPKNSIIHNLSEEKAVLYSPDITLGINFLIVTSRLMRNIVPGADIEIIEEHFRNKPEKSGMVIKIANLSGLDDADHINSVRVGGIDREHTHQQHTVQSASDRHSGKTGLVECGGPSLTLADTNFRKRPGISGQQDSQGPPFLVTL